jgi:hypothetical protein
MPMTFDGSGTITGLAAGGLPDGTITQADLAAGVAGTGPAFSAYQSSAQSYSSGIFTKVQLQTEEFDTNGNFDSTTNYRFTPTVAGYYQISGGAVMQVGSAQEMWVGIYKNGVGHKILQNIVGVLNRGCHGSALVYMNGSTDYVELYLYVNASGTVLTGATNTYFQGVLVRAA